MNNILSYDSFNENTRWIGGYGLDDDQILAITTTSLKARNKGYRPMKRGDLYYYNRQLDEFVKVVMMSRYDHDEFECTKADLEPAKARAKEQGLDTDVDLIKVRSRMAA